MKDHSMLFTMPASKNIWGFDTTTLDECESGRRTATTRSYPLGKPDEIITFESRPQKYRIINIYKINESDFRDDEFKRRWSRLEGWNINFLETESRIKAGWYQTRFEKVNESLTIEEVKEKLKLFASGFTFDPVKHKYTLESKTLKSVTQWLHNFHKPFDEAYWSRRKAEERGVPVETILQEWAETRDYANMLGTAVHEYIEHRLAGETPHIEDPAIKLRCEGWEKFKLDKLDKMQIVSQEQRMWSKRIGLAGTTDAIFYWKGEVVVGDWKTNKKFTTSKDKSYDKLLPPFAHLDDNNLNSYSIQLSMYRVMLEDIGIPTRAAFLCHIDMEGRANFYPALDLREIIRNNFYKF